MKPFDKYEYYLASVQSPDTDAEFIEKTYREINKKKPEVFREDFCAAFALCCSWVKRNQKHKAIGIDLDPEPLAYGREHYLSKLSKDEQSRVNLIEGDVLDKKLPRADVIAALNFSYFIFKKRTQLLDYFKACHHSLKTDGILIMDCFGGPDCMEPNEHETEHDDFSYFWDQDTYNPINHHAQFYIHFKRKGEKKRKKVFSYDWRLWSLAELQDLAEEAGFKKSYIYWEGTDKDGEGNGIFKKSKEGEICGSWVAYMVAKK